jgi:hypothetical protein
MVKKSKNAAFSQPMLFDTEPAPDPQPIAQDRGAGYQHLAIDPLNTGN